jgi:hypothetical protein
MAVKTVPPHDGLALFRFGTMGERTSLEGV